MNWEVETTGGTSQKLRTFYYQKPDGLKYPELTKASERRFNCTRLLGFHVKKDFSTNYKALPKKIHLERLSSLLGGRLTHVVLVAKLTYAIKRFLPTIK